MIDPSQNSNNVGLSLSAREKLVNRLQAHRALIKNSISNENQKKEEEEKREKEVSLKNEVGKEEQGTF